MPNEDSELERARKRIPQQIRDTFDRVAKTAMQGSAEADDSSLNVLEKVHKAYGRVTLIVDDAMRGLSELNDLVAMLVILAGVDQGARPEDAEPEDVEPPRN